MYVYLKQQKSHNAIRLCFKRLFSIFFVTLVLMMWFLLANCYTTTMSKWRHISVPEMFCGWMSGLLDKTQIPGFSNPSAAVSAHTWCLPHNHFVLSEKEKGNTKFYHTCAHISMWLIFTVESLWQCLFPHAIYLKVFTCYAFFFCLF